MAARGNKKGKHGRLSMGRPVGKEDAVIVETLHGWSPNADFDDRLKAIVKLTKEHGCERVVRDLQLAAGGAPPGSKLRTNGWADARLTRLLPECRKAR